jgi:hypothetical protein
MRASSILNNAGMERIDGVRKQLLCGQTSLWRVVTLGTVSRPVKINLAAG